VKQHTRGLGSNGTVNALKTWFEFANPLRWWELANFDLLNDFIVPIFGGLLPSLMLAEVVSQNDRFIEPLQCSVTKRTNT
ncbi:MULTISPECIES: hypothetical protein, partial [Pseudomonas syringae group]|uniref:hypothetical protein n=1 Tax=Pseudomonas syringae group TaxID=136849 RepID=UPI001C1FA03E